MCCLLMLLESSDFRGKLVDERRSVRVARSPQLPVEKGLGKRGKRAVLFSGRDNPCTYLAGDPPQHSLFTVFSQFGLLYSVRVFPNAAVAGPGFYAVIKFYSAKDAHRAQKACDQKQLFQKSPVKVRLGTRHKVVQHQALPLNSSRCQELANYYFGFNGWSKRILELQDLSDTEERGNENGNATGAGLQKQSVKFFCALEVVVPSHECRSPGAGVAWEPLDQLEEGPLSFLMKRKTTQKLAIQKALSDAFQKLLIVVLESGKIAVAYRPCEEITDARSEEEQQDLIQVGYFSWKQYGQGEEEYLSDFSFEEEEFRLPELD
ncbi:RAD52 motif-containing protein 1 isoform X1 [Equus przewalskii]|uniref:RAD52 motif-containing protein 1 n=1 Tax=Equus przewalskii TaxID=9798 RepID=A0ABM4JKC4_EQUPR|nr:RAD52 motif-containing protein 1 isoform X1 [Equus caballus]